MDLLPKNGQLHAYILQANVEGDKKWGITTQNKMNTNYGDSLNKSLEEIQTAGYEIVDIKINQTVANSAPQIVILYK